MIYRQKHRRIENTCLECRFLKNRHSKSCRKAFCSGVLRLVFAKTLQILQKLFVLILVFVKKNSKKLKKIKKIYKNPLTNRFFGANMSNVIRK